MARAAGPGSSAAPAAAADRVTDDALFAGAVTLRQPAPGAGYRVNQDSLLLAAFARHAGRRAKVAVDLGAGVGAIALALDHLGAAQDLILIERQPDFAALAQYNVEANGLADRGRVLCADVGEGLARLDPRLAHGADLVVVNPPYVSAARDGRGPRGGRPLQQASRRDGRHGEVAPFLQAAAHALGRRGRCCFSYPAHALMDLIGIARLHRLEPKRLRFVHGAPSRAARIALVELVHGRPGGLVVLDPLVETDGKGHASDEVRALLVARRAEQAIEDDGASGADA